MCSPEDLIKSGWYVAPKSLPSLVQKTSHGKPEEVIHLLLDADLREFGAPWIADHRKPDQLEANGRVVQLVRLRNIAIPQADEDMGSHQAHGDPRLFRMALTDGRTTISALDVDNHDRLSMNTPPGTKIRLLGTIQISLGFLVLRKDQFQVLGGNVAHLINEWTVTKQAKEFAGRPKMGDGSAPPFVPFGSHEATALVQSEAKFLQSLRRNKTDAVFDSFKLATSSTSTSKENEFDASFLERRQGVIAEVKGSTQTPNHVHRAPMSATSRFQAGGSKFAHLQAEKSQAYDESLAKLVSLGYPVPLATSALKISKGDYQAAVDRLIASATSGVKLDDGNNLDASAAVPRGGPRGGRGGRAGGGGRRGGGRRGGRGGYDPDEEDDPYFDPAAAAAAAGLPSRPSTGLTPLADLMPTAPRPSTGPLSSHPGPSGSTNRSIPAPKPVRLPVGCPILAQNMTGDYEEAVMLGHLTTPGTGGAGGDKVVLVVYTRNRDGRQEEEEELVPLSLIRSLNKERLTLDMVPPAPTERARVYNVGGSEQRSFNSGAPFMNGDQREPVPSRGYRDRGRSGFRPGGSRSGGGGGSRGPIAGRRGFCGSQRGQ